MNEAHRTRLKGFDGEPLTCWVLVRRLVAEYGITISVSTLRNELKRTGYVWKRIHYSLKKCDPGRFEQARHDIAELIGQAQAGAIELAYVDEAGFAPQPLNHSACMKSGETYAVTTKRTQRLSVIGALLSSGRLMTALLWQSIDDVWFFGFLMALIERVSNPLAVVLDNASIHTAKKLKPY